MLSAYSLSSLIMARISGPVKLCPAPDCQSYRLWQCGWCCLSFGELLKKHKEQRFPIHGLIGNIILNYRQTYSVAILKSLTSAESLCREWVPLLLSYYQWTIPFWPMDEPQALEGPQAQSQGQFVLHLWAKFDSESLQSWLLLAALAQMVWESSHPLRLGQAQVFHLYWLEAS